MHTAGVCKASVKLLGQNKFMASMCKQSLSHALKDSVCNLCGTEVTFLRKFPFFFSSIMGKCTISGNKSESDWLPGIDISSGRIINEG